MFNQLGDRLKETFRGLRGRGRRSQQRADDGQIHILHYRPLIDYDSQ